MNCRAPKDCYSDNGTVRERKGFQDVSEMMQNTDMEANEYHVHNCFSSHGSTNSECTDDHPEIVKNTNEKPNDILVRRNSNILGNFMGALKIATKEIRNQEEAALVAVCDNIERNVNEHIHSEKIFDKAVSSNHSAWLQKHLQTKTAPKLNERPLNEDIYSILFVAKTKSIPTLYALGVMALQMVIISVFLLDLIPRLFHGFEVPVNVGLLVRIAQALTIFLMVTTQDDLIQGVSSIYNGYSSDVLRIAPHATKRKFVIVYCLQTIIGFTYQIAIILLIMKSDEIVSMLLNFAALSFIAMIDDIGFMIAANFLITDELGILARQIQRIVIPIPVKFPSNESPVSSYRSINFLYLLSFYYAYYLYFVSQQIEGLYSCNSILVQFGDQVDSYLGVYSGVYERRRFIGSSCYLINNRFVYFLHDTRLHAMFAYCDVSQSWTFHNITDKNCEEINPCENFWVTSQEVGGYDIRDAADSKWSISAGSSLDHFFLQCNDEEGCHNNGILDEFSRRCSCFDGNYGVNCEFSEAVLCKRLFRSFQDSDDTIPFSIMTNSSLKELAYRPLFSRETTLEGSSKKSFELILFDGARWAYYNTEFVMETDQPHQINSVEELFDRALAFEAFPVLYTELVYFKTYLDKGTPSMLNWIESFYTNVTRNESYNINRLVCDECDPTSQSNPCKNEGICEQRENETFYQCTCPRNFRGYICEEYIHLN